VSDHTAAHARLSPSSAERWVSCPASVRLVESQGRTDDGGSEWAAEGTRAHNLAEIEASYAFGMIDQEQYHVRKTSWLRIAESHGDDVEEMEGHVLTYVVMLQDIMARRTNAVLHLEQRVQTGVPGCWGTGDAIIVSPTTVDVVDLKYGKGVIVKAHENPQLMLYGCGALEMFDGVLGDVQDVTVSVCQPRVNNLATYELSAVELREWRDNEVLPMALLADDPDAPFGPSETACRWCPVAGVCKPRMLWVLRRDFGDPDLMDADELASAWESIADVRNWCNAVEAEALRQAYSEGVTLPRLKVVLSGGKRSIPNTALAVERLAAEGYDEDQVTRRTMKPLGELEKLVGKTRLPAVLGDALTKSDGRPSLVGEDDKREAVTSLTQAREDFRVEDPDE